MMITMMTMITRMTRITTRMIDDDDSETIAATSQVAVRRPLTMSLSINRPHKTPSSRTIYSVNQCNRAKYKVKTL